MTTTERGFTHIAQHPEFTWPTEPRCRLAAEAAYPGRRGGIDAVGELQWTDWHPAIVAGPALGLLPMR